MTSFTEDMRRRGMTPASRTLDLRVVAGRRAISAGCSTSRRPSPC